MQNKLPLVDFLKFVYRFFESSGAKGQEMEQKVGCWAQSGI
jgi:hypothetical protein